MRYDRLDGQRPHAFPAEKPQGRIIVQYTSLGRTGLKVARLEAPYVPHAVVGMGAMPRFNGTVSSVARDG
jgi:hypothetical protein